MDTILIHGLGQGPDSWGNIPENLVGNGGSSVLTWLCC